MMEVLTGEDTPPVVFVSLVFAAFWALWIFHIRPMLEAQKPLNNLPMLPNSHWLLGHLPWMIKTNFLARQEDLVNYSDDKGRVSNWLGPRFPSVCLHGWKDADKLLKASVSRKAPALFKHHMAMGSGPNNLLFLNGKPWAVHQKALKSALHAQYIQDSSKLQRIVIQATTTLVERIRERILNNPNNTSLQQDIAQLMTYITLDVFGLAAFSHDFECCKRLRLSQFQQSFHAMVNDGYHRMQTIWQIIWPPNFFYWIPTQRNKDYLIRRQEVRSFLSNIVQSRRQEKVDRQQSTSASHNDLLDKLMEVHGRDSLNGTQGESKSDKDKEDLFIDVLLSILLAGFETVSTALTYAIYMVSQHPEVEACCLKEIQQNLPKDRWGSASQPAAKKSELPYCRAVITETLRIHPVATATSRTLEKPLQLDDDLTIPTGYQVAVSFWNVHRSAKFFPKPLEFRPDRWVKWDSQNEVWIERRYEEEEELDDDDANEPFTPAGNTQAFLAFSGGARGCPGRHFAMEEATLALAILIQNLRFTVDPSYKVETEWKGIVQMPKDGIPASIETRTTSTQ